MNRFSNFLFGVTIVLFAISCSKKESPNEVIVEVEEPMLYVNIDNSQRYEDEKLNAVMIGAYNKSGALLSSLNNALPNKDGLYELEIDPETVESVVVLAGDEALLPNDVSSSLSDLKKLTIGDSAEGVKPFYQMMCEGSDIKGAYATLPLVNGVAVVDVAIASNLDVELESMTITGLATKSYLMAGSPMIAGGEVSMVEVTNFGTFVEGKYSDLIYIYEQSEADVSATINATFGGYRYILEVDLPQSIKRDQRYVININSEGANLTSDLKIEGWGVENDVDAEPSEVLAIVDKTNSTFPEGTLLSATLDTIYVKPYFKGDITLTLEANSDLELSGYEGEFSVKPITPSSSGDVANSFTLTFDAVNITKQLTHSKLFVKAAGEELYSDQYVTVVREPYRTRIEGVSDAVSEATNIRYPDYKDGRLATLSSTHSIASIVSKSTDNQFNWVRVDTIYVAGGTAIDYIALEGGFKPNDTEATGQKQGTNITVTYSDGYSETFTFERYRKSLPVVLISGRYWMKYNLTGKSNSYDDQIGFDMDKPDIYTYLKSATAEEFAKYAGGNYKGITTTPLTIEANPSGTLLFREYEDVSAAEMYSVAANYMTPAGFSIPTQQEIGTILHESATLNLTKPYDVIDRYNTSSGQRMQLSRSTRTVTMNGVVNYPLYLVKVAQDNNPETSLVLVAMGNQTDAVTYNPGSFAMALYNPGNNRHFTVIHSEASCQLKVSGYSSASTKVIRAIKDIAAYTITE